MNNFITSHHAVGKALTRGTRARQTKAELERSRNSSIAERELILTSCFTPHVHAAQTLKRNQEVKGPMINKWY